MFAGVEKASVDIEIRLAVEALQRVQNDAYLWMQPASSPNITLL